MKIVVKTFGMLMMVLCLLTMTVSAKPADDGPGPFVIGYYPAWVKGSYPAEAVDFGTLTHLIHSFAWPEKDGSIALWEDFHYPELIEATHAAGRKISVAFGGWGNCEGFPPVAADPVLRKTFIDNVVKFCEDYGYDGVDLDWEFPANPKERDDLTTLVYELRDALDSMDKPMLLTMAISAGSWSGDHNDYARLKGKIDWFNNMTYDFYGTWTSNGGHNAPLYAAQESVDASMRFLMRRMKIPAQKLAMGVPFYGRRFRVRHLYGPSEGGEGVIYNTIAGLIKDGGWTRKWDDVSLVPYLVSDDGKEMLFYDDPESLAIKCDYALEKGFRGVMIWSVGSDYTDGRHQLLDTLGNKIKPR